MRKLFGMLILLTMMMSTGSLHAEEPIRLDPVTVEAQQEISPECNIETIDLGTEAKPGWSSSSVHGRIRLARWYVCG